MKIVNFLLILGKLYNFHVTTYPAKNNTAVINIPLHCDDAQQHITNGRLCVAVWSKSNENIEIHGASVGILPLRFHNILSLIIHVANNLCFHSKKYSESGSKCWACGIAKTWCSFWMLRNASFSTYAESIQWNTTFRL